MSTSYIWFKFQYYKYYCIYICKRKINGINMNWHKIFIIVYKTSFRDNIRGSIFDACRLTYPVILKNWKKEKTDSMYSKVGHEQLSNDIWARIFFAPARHHCSCSSGPASIYTVKFLFSNLFVFCFIMETNAIYFEDKGTHLPLKRI